MAMAMASSEYWQVVGDAFCNVIEPGNLRTANIFLMEFEAVIRRVTSNEVDRLLDSDVIPRVIKKRTSIELDNSSSLYMNAVLSETLRQLLVPLEERSSMVEKVMFKASEAAPKPSPYAGGKRLRMRVMIDIYVIDDDVDENAIGGGVIVGNYYESTFTLVNTLSIE